MAICGDCTYFTSCFNSHERHNNEDHEICGRYLRYEHEESVAWGGVEMSEYVVDFGDKSSAFVGLAMAEAESHGATLKERIVRCRDCEYMHVVRQWTGIDMPECWLHASRENALGRELTEPDGFCAWGERREVGTTCRRPRSMLDA